MQRFFCLCVAASERIVHLRTPKEATVAKVIESCMKMLGTTDDKSLFSLKESAGDVRTTRHLSVSRQTDTFCLRCDFKGSSEDLQPERQIGTLLKATSEQTQLELHLCKMVITFQQRVFVFFSFAYVRSFFFLHRRTSCRLPLRKTPQKATARRKAAAKASR